MELPEVTLKCFQSVASANLISLPWSILYKMSANKEVFTFGTFIFKPIPLSIGSVVLRLLVYSKPKFLTTPANVIEDPIGKTIPPS